MSTTLIPVPYLPVVGMINPNENYGQIINDLVKTGDKLLPYDKANTWRKKATETIYTNRIASTDKSLIIRTHRAGKDVLYIYGETPDNLPQADKVIAFSRHRRALEPNETCTVALIDEFTTSNSYTVNSHIVFAHTLPDTVLQTALDCGDDSIKSGIKRILLDSTIKSTKNPTLVYVSSNQVLGILGPIHIMPDSNNVPRTNEGYLGVNYNYLNKGIATGLWQAMRHYSVEHGSKYLVLQAVLNSPAEKFYSSIGLRKLGYIYRASNV